MNKIGNYKELSHGDRQGPYLKDCCRENGEIDEAKIIEYLNNGEVLSISPCIVKDVLNPDIVIGTLEYKSDGMWEWSNDLAYYVEKYHVVLPKEFITHVRNV
jgi:hypothetical protein